MSGLGLLSATDVVRSFGADVSAATEETVYRFLKREYVSRKPGGFGYGPAIKASTLFLTGHCDLPKAREIASGTGRPMGRPFNEGVFSSIESWLASHSGPAYAMGFAAVKIGAHRGEPLYIGLKPSAVRVSGRRRLLVYPSFRKTFLPSLDQAALECSIVLGVLAVNDYFGAEIEYVTSRTDGGKYSRICKVYNQVDLNIRPIGEVNRLMTIYKGAVSRLIDEGLATGRSRTAGYSIVDPENPGLFG